MEGSARSRGARVGARFRAPGKLTVHRVRLDPRGVARGGVARRGHARGHRVLQILQGRRVARRELRVQEKVHRRASVVDARRRARRWAGRLGPTWQKARFLGATPGRSTGRFPVRETRRKNLTQVAHFFELFPAPHRTDDASPASSHASLNPKILVQLHRDERVKKSFVVSSVMRSNTVLIVIVFIIPRVFHS